MINKIIQTRGLKKNENQLLIFEIVFGGKNAIFFEVESSFVQIDDYDFLKERNIGHIVPWIMPTGKNVGSAKVNNEKAIANGLSFTPLKQTVADTHQWWTSDAISQEQRDKVELDPESVLVREKAIIEEWRAM